MKYSTKTYAQMLIAKMGGDKRSLARKFWFALQRNNQYRDMAKVLAELDREYARQNGAVYTEIVSENKLSNSEIEEIENKLAKILTKKIISKNITKPDFGPGIIVKTDEIEMDFSVMGKIEKLKRSLIHNS